MSDVKLSFAYTNYSISSFNSALQKRLLSFRHFQAPVSCLFVLGLKRLSSCDGLSSLAGSHAAPRDSYQYLQKCVLERRGGFQQAEGYAERIAGEQ